MAWDDDLSPEQREFASHDARVLRLVAGPGTGKTRVMTRRVAYLIEEGGVEPSSILALTFSRAAARELRERLESLLGAETGDRPGVYTLHAFALRQLLRNRGAPTLPHPIRIADDHDERHVIEEELSALTDARVRDVRREFQNLASDWETLNADEDGWERQHPNPRFLGAWRRHREVYGYTLRAELVYALKKALNEDPDFDLERDYRHILTDEYQDLNRCEIAVIERLIETERHLFAAGDDDQSIYGFRNAFPLGLREFSSSFPGSESGELVECHRCDAEILSMALNVAEQDENRIPKDLRPLDDADDGQVEAFGFRNITHEANGIAQLCRQLVDDAEVKPGDILILLRNDPQGVYSEPIISALRERDLEAELPSDPLAPLASDRGQELVAVLRLLGDRTDGLAWRQLLRLRRNQIGDGSLLAVYRLADERGERYDVTLQGIAESPDVLEHSLRNRIAGEVRAINDLLDRLQPCFEDEAQVGLDAIMTEIGIVDEEGEALIMLLLGLLVDHEDPRVSDVEGALHGSRGNLDETHRSSDPDRIPIMTMHSAKGLTAEAVIVAACEDELVPGRTQGRRELDDERRLLYVSLTRARHFLFVTYARSRQGRQSHLLQVPVARTYTRFLSDFLSPTAG
jgi:DNA helicase II / ATP-dependent DNA helicase PcrA